MKTPHDKFCVLPWISLETSPIGTVRPCCLAEQEIPDDQGQKFDLNTAKFGDIQNSAYMRDLRGQFLRQEQPETCSKCWNEEAAGRTSKRMHTLNRLKHMIPDQTWTKDAAPLMFLDLKLGNICNLKCRICGSWSSSTFATEELAHIDPGQNKRNNHHYVMLKKGAWPRENPSFWSEIDRVSEQIHYIEFTGGEPFMIQEHFDLLQTLVDRGIAKGIEIHYNTNGTQFPEHAEKIWSQFKFVEIAFSIDDVAERFEYQRTNAVWNQVTENIKRFQRMRARMPNLRLQVCSTVNVFNVLYLEDLARWIDQQNFDFVYWNMLHEARCFCISTLTSAAKQVATQRLQQAHFTQRNQAEINKIIEFMHNGSSIDPGELLSKIQELDHRRGQDLAQVMPELAEILHYEKI
jgi:organic radical activating enzyme